MTFGIKISQIIKYEGPNDVLVWKHPTEDFNTTSQLIVHESQEAIFFKDGQALDLFGPGRYTLSTENIPFLRKIINIPTDGKTPFHCEIYFINKVDIMDVFWGTAQPMPIQDPVYNIILPVRANGQFALRVADSRKLLIKLVGTTTDMTKNRIAELFKGLLLTRVKNLIAEMMTSGGISFLEIHSHLNEVSSYAEKEVALMYADYGMDMVNFFINSISVPADDPGYVKIRTALASAKEKELLAKGTRAEMDILGYSYQQKRTFDVLDKAAQNEGAGAGIMGAGMGLGMGVNVGNMVGGAMGGALVNISEKEANTEQMQKQETTQKKCSNCGSDLPATAKFCFVCGTKLEEVCTKCGARIVAGAKFCYECGEKL